MKKNICILLVGILMGAFVILLLNDSSNGAINPVATLPDGAVYEGDMNGTVIEGNGRMEWPNGSVYQGEFKDGLFNGKGLYKELDGFSYEGIFTNGALTGQGVLKYPNGDEYEGEVEHAAFHGKGTLKSKQGFTYTGDFQKGKFHGEGKYTASHGTYTGHFVEGEFTGQGTFTLGKSRYEGEFDNWLFKGKGKYLDAQGNQYVGTFDNGLLSGEGEKTGDKGERYLGSFKNGNYHGAGKLTTQEGDQFEGNFKFGNYHGKGVLTYSTPVDGVSKVSGKWSYGNLIESDDPNFLRPDQLAETALYNQNRLLEGSWRKLNYNDPGKTEMYFLGIAGDGTQGVFRRETLFVKDYFDQHLGTVNKSIALINGDVTIKEAPLATLTSIKRTLGVIAERMDPENDILFVFMTSHGSRDFQFSMQQKGMRMADLPAQTLADMLADIPVRHKVVVVSACFSGGFIAPLKNDNTLIITAAAANKASFGCADRNEFTYFGEAFFKDALPLSKSFVEAFDKAIDAIDAKEKLNDFKPSEPQIYKPENILVKLKEWRKQL